MNPNRINEVAQAELKAKQYAAQEQINNPPMAGSSIGGMQYRVTNQLYQRRARLLDQLHAVEKAIEDLNDPAVQKALNIFTQAEGA